MRNEVLKMIELYRDIEQGFPTRAGRWKSFYFVPEYGIDRFTSRKWANRSNTGAVHISETTSEDLNTLTDTQLLNVLIELTRQRAKQM